jgi:glycosyltransferase involved in cell wall biosynthesis
MKRQTEKLLEAEKEIHVIPFGVETDVFRRLPRRDSWNGMTVGIIKTLKPKYGLEYLLRAFRKVNDHFAMKEIEVRLVVYGEGPELKRLVDLARECDIAEKVFFMGRIPNTSVPSALAEIDVFVVSSVLDSESFGVAAVEAMACEVPVVVSDVDGLKEVVDHGATGYVVPRKNTEAMANAIIALLLDSHLRREMGRNGRKNVLDNYEWSKNVEAMLSLYRKCISSTI